MLLIRTNIEVFKIPLSRVPVIQEPGFCIGIIRKSNNLNPPFIILPIVSLERGQNFDKIQNVPVLLVLLHLYTKSQILNRQRYWSTSGPFWWNGSLKLTWSSWIYQVVIVFGLHTCTCQGLHYKPLHQRPRSIAQIAYFVICVMASTASPILRTAMIPKGNSIQIAIQF